MRHIWCMLRGNTFVYTYNWIQYFEQFTIKTALKGISNMYNFRFAASSPGAVFVKSDSSAAEWKINLLRDTSNMPTITIHTLLKTI